MALWVIDLDGVMWRGEVPIEGAASAVAALLGRRDRVVFCTNHATAPDDKLHRLRSIGVPDCPIVTSGDAVLGRCRGASSVLVLGDRSLVEHLGASGVPCEQVTGATSDESVTSAEVVVVGGLAEWDRTWIGRAADAVRAGARFLSTNDDATFPTSGPDGPRLLPGNGALAAAVATAAGCRPEVTGKPHAAMAEVVRERHGAVDVVVGDRIETDGGFATTLGARFALVLSGVTSRADLPVTPSPWMVADDLRSLVDQAPRKS